MQHRHLQAPWMIPLSAPSDLQTVGGKGLGLMRLHAGGLPVPEGFCITTAAFREGLGEMLSGLSSLGDVERALAGASLPEVVASPLREAYRALGAASVAVRSSAVDEDSHARSFAGQQVTVLSVQSEDAFLAAVLRVWLGAFSARTHVYRHSKPLTENPPDPVVGVVVQRMVDADAGGVLFTANPLEDPPQTAMICATQGLGEAVVEGDSTDTFWIQRRDGALCRSQLAQAKPCLSDAQIKTLWEVGQQVEALFGGPQDIEFAWHNKTLWLLQARPVVRAAAQTRVYTNANVGEALPGVGTPMTWSLIRGFANKGFRAAFGALGLEVPEGYALFASYRGRVYLNLSEFLSVASQIPLLTRETLLKISGAQDTPELRAQEARLRLKPWRFLARLPWTAPKALLSQATMPSVGKRWAESFGRERRAFYQLDLKADANEALGARLAWLEGRFARTGEVMLGCSSNFMVSYVVVMEALRLLGGPESAALSATLLSGLTEVQSAAPGLELLELARWVKDHPDAREAVEQGQGWQETPDARQFKRLLDGFLDRWGHRAAREADLITPRWRENFGFLLEVIRQHLKAKHLPSAQEVEQEAKRRRLEATQLIRTHFLTGTGVVFRALLGWCQAYARLREALRSEVVATLGLYRHLMLEVGRRLVVEGRLAQVEDVFFLEVSEVGAWLRGSAEALRLRVALRRSAYAALQSLPDPPDSVVEPPPTTNAADEPHTDAVSAEAGAFLQGLPGSPGRATGRAFVLKALEDLHGAHLEGAVLIAPLTDVGWTPLFLSVAAVVTDKGGPLSHACVVAREYGLPVVVNARDATRLIQTGDIVTVDGTTGSVRWTQA